MTTKLFSKYSSEKGLLVEHVFNKHVVLFHLWLMPGAVNENSFRWGLFYFNYLQLGQV